MHQSLLNGLGVENPGALLERLLAIVDDAVVVVDARFEIVLFNDGAVRMFGYPVADVLGRELSILIPELLRSAHAAHVQAFARSAKLARRMAERSNIQGRRADGSLFYAEASIAQVDLDGAVFFAAIVRDVSAAYLATLELERARSEAEAATRAKGMFLANMSHEIRTPLNAVIGMTSLLLDTPMSDQQRDFASTIRSSSQSLMEIISDILDYSKAVIGEFEIEQQAFDLRQCVEDALDLVAPRAAEKRLNLAYLIEDGTPESLLGDVTRLRQILVNLLSNAVKFTQQGEVFVVVDSEAVDRQTHSIHFAVHDSGIGIAAEHLPRLFQSFSQVDASTTRKFGGTGLGLAISKRLAELMDGTVTVQSDVERGSTFRLQIQAKLGPVGEPSVFLQRNVAALVGKRVLIVDDNLTNRRLLTRLALRWGMLPSTLPSALEALDRIRHGESYDLAIVAMQMPGTGGLDLALDIHRHASASGLPIIVLTSLGQHPTLADDRGVHFAAVLSKPIKASQLFSIVLQELGPAGATTPAISPAGVAPPASKPQLPRLPLKVLIAEDNVVNQRVALLMLDRLGYSADVAVNGLEAIDAVERKRYDVVLMDIQMPEMDGLQAARWIGQRRGQDGSPHLIAMTANAMPGDREHFLSSGFDAYLPKPIEAEPLAAALAQVSSAGPADARRSLPLEPVLDRSRLEHLHSMQQDGKPALVPELIDMFVNDSPGHLGAMVEAVAAADVQMLGNLAHRYLSVTQNIGATRLSTLCMEIERQSRLGRLQTAARIVGALGPERDRAQEALLAVRPNYA